jgi:hypothetical protein
MLLLVTEPDPDLQLLIDNEPETDVHINYVELGRNFSTYLERSRCAAPMIVAQLLVKGEYIAWLADDERMKPEHIMSLVDMIEECDVDFAYSKTDMYCIGYSESRWIIGSDPPRMGQVTNVVYKTKLIEYGLTRLGVDRTPDWTQISEWINAGATWAFLPRVTFEHRADY